MKKILWAEGTLLNQQVFQQWDNYWTDAINYNRQLHSSDNWGIAQLEFSSQDLQHNLFTLLKLEAIMPNGLIIKHDNQQGPHLTQVLSEQKETIHLHISHESSVENLAGYPNPKHKPTFRDYSKTCSDLYDPDRQACVPFIDPILTLSTTENIENHTSIPLLQVKKNNHSHYALCRSFIPPIIYIQCCQHLISLCQSICQNINSLCLSAKNTQLAPELNSAINYRTILTLFNNKLRNQLQCNKTHPKQLFQTLTMMSQLLAPHSLQNLIYNHVQPEQSLYPLITAIMDALNNMNPNSDNLISFDLDPNGILHFVGLPSLCQYETITLNCKSDRKHNISLSELSLQIKADTSSSIHSTISQALPGVPTEIVHTHNTKNNNHYSIYIKKNNINTNLTNESSEDPLCVYIPPVLTATSANIKKDAVPSGESFA